MELLGAAAPPVRCPWCGEQSEEGDRFCRACGQDLVTEERPWAPAGVALQTGAPAAQEEAVRVPSYLGWAAALFTLCWPAWPAGVAAVVYASRAEARLDEGDRGGAERYSDKAKTWCWITGGTGLVLWVVALGLVAGLD